MRSLSLCSLFFRAEPKANDCPVTITTTIHTGCVHCNGTDKIKNRDCLVSTSGNAAVIAEAGGVKSHIEFEVMVTNDDNGSLFGTDTCTICTQNPSVDFVPDCSGTLDGGGSVVATFATMASHTLSLPVVAFVSSVDLGSSENSPRCRG